MKTSPEKTETELQKLNMDEMSVGDIFKLREWLIDITNGVGIQVSREEFKVVKIRMVEIDNYLKEKFLC